MKFAFIATHRGDMAGGMVMRGARCLARRVLCLANSIAECPREGQRTTTGQGASQLPRQRSDLWRSACLARPTGGRGRLRPTSD